eukprot:1627018-Rhodomonas_salina.1
MIHKHRILHQLTLNAQDRSRSPDTLQHTACCPSESYQPCPPAEITNAMSDSFSQIRTSTASTSPSVLATKLDAWRLAKNRTHRNASKLSRLELGEEQVGVLDDRPDAAKEQ